MHGTKTGRILFCARKQENREKFLVRDGILHSFIMAGKKRRMQYGEIAEIKSRP